MKYSKYIPYLILFLISISITGCYSPHIERAETHELEPYNKDAQQYYNIMYIHMKDSSIVDVYFKNPRYMKSYRDMKDVIVYNSGKDKGYISVKDISFVVVEKNVINPGMTVAVTGLVILSAAGVLFLLYLLSFSNMH